MRSDSKQAKEIIRHHIFAFYDTLKDMKRDADAYNANRPRQISVSEYTKGAGLVEGACFLCYTNDIEHFLEAIYGSKVVYWSNMKCYRTYKHLIGREYAEMLREQGK